MNQSIWRWPDPPTPSQKKKSGFSGQPLPKIKRINLYLVCRERFKHEVVFSLWSFFVFSLRSFWAQDNGFDPFLAKINTWSCITETKGKRTSQTVLQGFVRHVYKNPLQREQCGTSDFSQSLLVQPSRHLGCQCKPQQLSVDSLKFCTLMVDNVQWLSQSDYSVCISILVEFY